MLSLAGNLIDDDMMRFMALGLKENNTITQLDLSHNKIGNRGLRQLAKAPMEPTLANPNPNSSGTTPRRTFSLHTLASDPVPPSFLVLALTRPLPRLPCQALGTSSVLTDLDLCDNQIAADGGRYLGRALKTNQVLLHLNLRLNRLSDGGGRMLFYGMRLNPGCPLLSLNVSSNALGLESAKALSEFLQDDPPLHQVSDC